MPDIQLRFHRDMLVLSSPIAPVLARQGFELDGDVEYATLMEPEAVEDALRLNLMAGVQCLVTETAGMTPARLAHRGMAERLPELARAAVSCAAKLRPQHVLVELGPCGLPLDASSKASLNENRDQYARAARAFEGLSLDGFFLNGFSSPSDLKCALMGLRQVSGLPVFASVNVGVDGMLADGRHGFDEALDVMAEFEASVAGFCTQAPVERVCAAGGEAALARARAARRRGAQPPSASGNAGKPVSSPRRHDGGCPAPSGGRRAVPARNRPGHARLCRRPGRGDRRPRCASTRRGGIAAMAKLATNTRRSEHYGQLQRVVDSVFADGGKFVRRLDVVVTAESFDLPDDLDEIIALLPPGTYTRQRLCDQLNSAIGGHAWGQVYGTVE